MEANFRKVKGIKHGIASITKKELKKQLVELNILILRWCFYSMNHAYKICTSLTPSATP
jgi:hypothetical protein